MTLQQYFLDIKCYLCICGSAIVSLICTLVGADTPAFKFLLSLMVADYASGLLVGWLKKSKKTKNGGLSSSVGAKGIAHKCMILLYVYIGIKAEELTSVTYTAEMVIGFYIVMEIISILENGGLLGLPYPKQWKKALEALYDDDKEA